MFKYKLIILVTIVLLACNRTEKTKEEVKDENVTRYDEVISSTDSLIIFADKKINKIKKNNKEQLLVMDSLQHTIEVEQYTIHNLNKEFRRVKGIDEILQVTKKELEEALSMCKEKEGKLVKLGDSLIKVREKLINENVYLVNFYSTKIKSLEETINSLNDSLSLVKVEEPEDKKKKKRKRREKNN